MNQILTYSMTSSAANQNRARQAFQTAYAGQWWRLLWLRLRGKNGRLLDLNRLKMGINITASHALGMQLVPIARIVGSEGRSRGFTAEFRPTQTHTKQRWMRVADAHADDMPLPPVELILIGTCYFVRDGHHRVSVARYFGQTHIEAEVTQWVVNTAVSTNANKPEIDWQLWQRMQIC